MSRAATRVAPRRGLVLCAVLLPVMAAGCSAGDPFSHGRQPGSAAAAKGDVRPVPDETAEILPARLWLTREEIQALPTSGAAWEQVLEVANEPAGVPDIADQDQDNNVRVLAKALVYVRTGTASYRDEVVEDCLGAIGTEQGGRTLALGRNLVAYVVSAALVGLDPQDDRRFRAWLRRVLSVELEGRTLRSTQEERPNNWGTHAGASRAAVAVYLGDQAELERAARVFRGWLGNRGYHDAFTFGDDLSWQEDPHRPLGINPLGAQRGGELIGGVIPDDMRRGCSFQFPPCPTGYPWEALQGAVVMAEILDRQGYDAWSWSDQALRRAVQFLADLDQRYPASGWWASGDDEGVVWVVNHAYGTQYPAVTPAQPGKNMAWTDWTHASR